MPLIDAAMRELRETGFSSNRARQFLASYLCVELKLDWRLGAEAFEHLLVDYDVHANWCSWARAAGVCGQGFGHGGHRWFNLAEEVARFDKDGKFVRLWVPELRDLDVEFIHRPWQMSAQRQEAAKCIIGKDYPVAPDTESKRSLDGLKVDDVLMATTRDGKKTAKGQGKTGKGGYGSGKGSKRDQHTAIGSHVDVPDMYQQKRNTAGEKMYKRRWNQKSSGRDEYDQGVIGG